MPNELSSAFNRDRTAVLNETQTPDDQSPQADLPSPSELSLQSESPVQVIDPALLELSEEFTPGTPRMQLFFILGAVQTLSVCIFADSGSVRYLIDNAVNNRLPTSLHFEALET